MQGEIPLDSARNIAREFATAVARGEDPQGDKMQNRQAPNLADLWSRFEAADMQRLKTSIRRDYDPLWRNTLKSALGTRRVNDMTQADVD